MNGKAKYILLGSAATLGVILMLGFQDPERQYFPLVSVTGSDVRALYVAGGVAVDGDVAVNGRIRGIGTIPQGTLLFFPALSDCPTNWTRYAEVQGRMVVGLQDGGTVDGTSVAHLGHAPFLPG